MKKITKICTAPFRVYALIRFVKSVWATYRLTGRFYPIRVRICDHRIRCDLRKGKGATVQLGGTLAISGWSGQTGFVFIALGSDATLKINGDFLIGTGSRIVVDKGAKLLIGGRQNESASGITERAIILCQKSITIGNDFLGAWGLFITDSDHHQYGESNPPAEVSIGDHVWMCPNSSVLKGSKVGSNSIVMQGAVVFGTTFPERSLIGGNPARRIGEAKDWRR